jgi:hypothetical protein
MCREWPAVEPLMEPPDLRYDAVELFAGCLQEDPFLGYS